MTVLDVRDLVVEYHADGVVRAVDGVSFSIGEGKTLAVVGESGSGKSTISQAVMGLLPPAAKVSGGSILFHDTREADGKPIDLATLPRNGAAMRDIRGNRIAMIFQEPMTSLSPLHTIGDQIGEAGRLHRGMDAGAAREATKDMLRLVRFPDPDRAVDAYPFELSGGLRQRAMIAMAMMCRPALLIADEPTTALDVTIQAEILKLLRDVQGELGMSILLITHDFGVVANMADDIVVVYHGRVVERGSAREIFTQPEHPYLKALLHAVPTFAMTERLSPIRPIEPKLDAFGEKCGGVPGTPLIEVDNVVKSFRLKKGGLFAPARTLRAIDQVSFTINTGECLGLVGESGSGKTTMAMAIMRAFAPTSGHVRVQTGDAWRDLASLKGADLAAYRKRVQLVFQDPFSSLNPRMSVNEIIREPMVIHDVGTKEERSAKVRELMGLVGLDPKMLRRYPHSLSGGQRQRVGIARALALRPDLLVCDEPVSALDVSVQAQVLNLLTDLRRELNLTYLFVSHNLAVVDYLATRIAVMCHGRLVELGATRDVIDNPLHPYTQALLTAVPDANLDRPLDFARLSAERASNPAAWPEPFRLEPGAVPVMIERAPGHFVCAPGEAPSVKEAA
ncbi:ABC transporter ATP-binding protein [Acuticoccus sp. I52.16.1]|uniref:ABC transporter ATP-binding protein n=1 Tax=Acuticoccus sp. I52.16.1 TaxID=2928472 RepID=UPI001FD5A265|nr:ABC transporter ATP-binding protein [Acuticoccus sp. I52.16.1]UOM34264.1 ABC transporter ATP-binding protein [Acuticoccus sp. I52.16.1]